MLKLKLVNTASALCATILMLCCASCGSSKTDTWYKDVVCRNSSTRWSSCVLEDGGDIYYLTANSIAKRSGSTVTTVVDKVGAESLFFLDGQLYYLEDGCVYKAVDGSGVEVCNSSKAELPTGGTRPAFTDFCVTDKYVCLSSLTNYVIAYSIKEDKFSVVCSNYSNGAVMSNRLYYITTGRDYTVYTVELSTLEKQKLLGSGKTRPQKNIYDRLQTADGQLYVANRDPAGITTIEIAAETVAKPTDKGTSSAKSSSKASSKSTSSTAQKEDDTSKIVINDGNSTHIYFALNTNELYYAYRSDDALRVVGPDGEYRIGTLDTSRSFCVVDGVLFYHSTDGQFNAVTAKFSKPTSSSSSGAASSQSNSSK